MIVAIAIFTVVSRIAELGASTGLVRMISRDCAVDRPDRITPTLFAARLPVLIVGTAFALLLLWCAPALAELFGGGKQTAAITDQVRILAPFVPIASLYTVLVQGSRGFGTMGVLVGVDKIGGRSRAPVLAALLLSAGGGATSVVLLWGVSTAVATVITFGCVVVLTGAPPTVTSRRPTDRTAGGRRVLVVLAAARRRAVVQRRGAVARHPARRGADRSDGRGHLRGRDALPPHRHVHRRGDPTGRRATVSSLITLGKRDDAHAVITQATSWQAAITWPVYLVVIAFSGVLLGVFGPDYVQAQWALILLSMGLLVAVVGGPSDAVILMSGRSRQSLANSTIAFGVNLIGNLVLVPIWGITAARRRVGRDARRRGRAARAPGAPLPRAHALVARAAAARSSSPSARWGRPASSRSPSSARPSPASSWPPSSAPRPTPRSCGVSGSRSICRHCSTACVAHPAVPFPTDDRSWSSHDGRT